MFPLRAAVCLALAACSAAPPPPPALPPPPVVTAAPATASPPPVAVEPPPPPAAVLSERPLTPVPLPPKTPAITAVGGRDDGEVWLFADGGDEVIPLRWDGAHVAKVPGGGCPKRTTYERVLFLGDVPVAVGPYADFDEAGTMITRRTGRTWACEVGPVRQILAFGPALLRYSPGYELVYGSERQPMPARGEASYELRAIAARAPHDVWLYAQSRGDVVHGNGVGWESRPPGVAAALALEVDSAGGAWLLGGDDAKQEGHALLRWDPGARAWQRLPVPDDLRAGALRVGGRRDDVWLIGKAHFHHLVGGVFHRFVNPLAELRAAWVAPSGELWIAGAATATRPAAGAVYRVPTEKNP